VGDSVIKAENVSKVYDLGNVASTSFRDSISRIFLGKQKSEPFWALQDISFELERGKILGIIGKNGAGKSTLLKIISRITKPTTGRIEIEGKLSSLLEVGTGFHPELTGKENIYLNGTILGMTREEIKNKFDAIVDFSGVEKFLDTPVKRYSSGMYVRLAFSVAAHLEPEILVIDEVLAVGDADFQKKCLGKMKEVAGYGRTVLFVSHNMGAVRSLCDQAILLEEGKIKMRGETGTVIDNYLNQSHSNKLQHFYQESLNDALVMQIVQVALKVNDETPKGTVFDVFDKISFELICHCKSDVSNHGIQVLIKNNGFPVSGAFDISSQDVLLDKRKKGKYKISFELPVPFLKEGNYTVDFHVSQFGVGSVQEIDNIIGFEIAILTRNPRFQFFAKNRPGVVALEPNWTHELI